jgi:hypothetical protein
MAAHIQNKGHIGPVTKSSAAGTGVAGAAGVLIVYILSLFGLEVPNEVAAALVVLIGAIGTLVGGKRVSPDTAARFQKTRGVLD